MKCPKCQAENPDGAEYCYLCYTRFSDYGEVRGREEAAKDILSKQPGSRIRCPSCGEISPLDARMCLKCGYALDEIEELIISEEEAARLEEKKGKGHGLEVGAENISEPIEITPDSDGAEVMRCIEDILARNCRARIHVRGRDSTTYSMKLIALMSEEHGDGGGELYITARLITEEAITHLDDVEMEIIVTAG